MLVLVKPLLCYVLSLWLSEASEITSSHIAVTHVQLPFLVDFVVSLQAYIRYGKTQFIYEEVQQGK